MMTPKQYCELIRDITSKRVALLEKLQDTVYQSGQYNEINSQCASLELAEVALRLFFSAQTNAQLPELMKILKTSTRKPKKKQRHEK
jgi:hypothetical protein